jgi:glycosyltransferase involved in cell wall biosynthesis
MELSLCMIVKNGAETLEACLKSAISFVDELIIVDTGSTDNTKEICKKFGAKIYDFKWINDFSAARNESLRYATKDWILWMDADDVIPEKSAQKINLLKQFTTKAAFIFHILNRNPLTDNPACLKKTFPHLRMFPNHKGICFKNAIHESNYDSATENKITILQTDIIIHHCGYSNAETVREKAVRNYRIQLQELGFPSMTQFYEFDFGQYHIYYAPNILSVFDVSKMKSFFLGEPFYYEPEIMITDNQLNEVGQSMINKKVYDLIEADINVKKSIQDLDKAISGLTNRIPSGLRIKHELAIA